MSPPPHLDPERQHYGITLAVLLVAALAIALQQTMVAPALPAIQRELETTATAVSFVFTAFLLTASISTPILGRLGDMFGKERMLVFTLSVFALGSLIAALSDSIWTLIAGRAIQGLGAATFPLAFGIIRDEFPPHRIGTGIGVVSAMFGIGGGVGLVVSGVIVDRLGYEWLFWLALPMIVAAIGATLRWIPESPHKSPAAIDWGGAALLSAALVALLIAISEANSWGWGSVPVLTLLVTAAALLAGWLSYERRQAAPLVDIGMMRERSVMATNLAALLVGFGMFSGFILIPQLVQLPESTGFGLGASVSGAGMFLVPSSIAMLFAGPLAGWIGDRHDSRLPLVAGTAAAATSFLFLALEHDPWAIYLATTLMGIGIGFSFAAMANLIVEAVPPARTGVATGMNTIMRTIGGSIGGQVAAAIIAGHIVLVSGLPDEAGFRLGFLVAAAGMALALVAALAIPARDRIAEPEPATAPGGG
ncbi:MAG TPA: MFS transporter [Solirubrobacterales bacterium]|nr:MFS transporter [Solirubrobacterales bacterium]